jgi:hypothetical protein
MQHQNFILKLCLVTDNDIWIHLIIFIILIITGIYVLVLFLLSPVSVFVSVNIGLF